jgi:hypothetical protein
LYEHTSVTITTNPDLAKESSVRLAHHCHIVESGSVVRHVAAMHLCRRGACNLPAAERVAGRLLLQPSESQNDGDDAHRQDCENTDEEKPERQGAHLTILQVHIRSPMNAIR